jgi:hypothetical protein
VPPEQYSPEAQMFSMAAQTGAAFAQVGCPCQNA